MDMLASSPSSHLQPGSPSTFTILGCTRGSLQTVGGVSRASPHVFAHCIFRLGNRTYSLAVLCLVAQSCPTLRPYDHSPPGSSVHGDSLGKNTGVGCHALLQGIFPTRGSNAGLPHCRWILYQMSHQGSPFSCYVCGVQFMTAALHFQTRAVWLSTISKQQNWFFVCCNWQGGGCAGSLLRHRGPVAGHRLSL